MRTFAEVDVDVPPPAITAFRVLAICAASSGLDGGGIFEMAATNFSRTCGIHDHFKIK